MKYTGRPPKYDNPEEMQKIIVEYFNECAAEGKKPTVSGLDYVLGLSRRQILEYENCIDNEIEECIRGRGDLSGLKDSLEYIIKTSNVLKGDIQRRWDHELTISCTEYWTVKAIL